MVEPTPITDAGLAELDLLVREAVHANQVMGADRGRVADIGWWIMRNGSGLVHRLRTSEARVKELEAALTKARHDIANSGAHPNMIPTLDPNDPDTPYERGVVLDVPEQKS